ncbi:MAG: extracellular solute-binding protein [Pseudonocardiales bacterium]|nr:extracellular solute-binding protein [Pseudonocardiales bacterium]
MRTTNRWVTVAVAAAVLTVTGCGGSGFDDAGAQAEQQTGPAALEVLVAGDPADTAAVDAVAQEWAAASGNTVTVSPANDMDQQLAQGFAAGNPPDLFMVDAGRFAQYAEAGNLLAYGDRLAFADDLYPTLRETFTYDGQLYCPAKDFSTLGLQINTDLWAAAGLTDADVPTTWEQLQSVATRLSGDGVAGLVFNDTRDRIGAFMAQAGGWVTNPDQTQATADSLENLAALQYVQGLLASGAAQYPKQIGSGDAIEAFGQGKAAMIIEGNWFLGAMQADYPQVNYTVAPLPAGPAGPGTLSFTQCWGIAAASEYQDQAVDLVTALMTPEAQIGFAEVFGVMPSLQSAADTYAQRFPDFAPFVEGADGAQGPVTLPDMTPVLLQFDTGLQSLPGADPQAILAELQRNTEAVIGS